MPADILISRGAGHKVPGPVIWGLNFILQGKQQFPSAQQCMVGWRLKLTSLGSYVSKYISAEHLETTLEIKRTMCRKHPMFDLKNKKLQYYQCWLNNWASIFDAGPIIKPMLGWCFCSNKHIIYVTAGTDNGSMDTNGRSTCCQQNTYPPPSKHKTFV